MVNHFFLEALHRKTNGRLTFDKKRGKTRDVKEIEKYIEGRKYKEENIIGDYVHSCFMTKQKLIYFALGMVSRPL